VVRKSCAPCASFSTVLPHRRPPSRAEGKKENAPGEILLGLLFDFYIQQDERVHPEVRILTHAVVEAVRPPRVGEEDERDCLAKVVQLQTASADRVHDGCIVYDARRDTESASAEEDVGVRRRAEGIADDEEGNVLGVRVSQDLVTLGLDRVTVREDE
jgi:hypothetical protein